MKSNKFLRCVIVLIGIFSSISAHNTAELQSAHAQLETHGEVYFKYYASGVRDVLNLADAISIDKVAGHEVYAFANAEEFRVFLTHNLHFETLTPPCEEGPPPEMSDYSPLPDWTKYPTFGGYKDIMAGFQTKYPDFVKVEEIGKSINNRELLVAKVSKNVAVKGCKAEWFLMGGIHGNEPFGSMLCMRLIEWLVENYTNDARAARILDSIELYILPFSNPDGTYKTGDHTISGAVRGNARNVDLNRNYPKVPGGGTNAAQEKETRAIIEWQKKRHIMMNMDYHAGVETAVYPYSGVSRRTTDEAWWKYVCRVYASLAQRNGPTGYYTDCINGICNGYHDLGYVAQGTTKDYFYYFLHARGISNELTSTKMLDASRLNLYWNANLDATLAYLLEVLNGIRGTVKDEVTKKGLRARVFVDNYDNMSDSSFVYADSSGGHGNYYRPILGGTYSVTYSHPGCVSKTVRNISVTTGRGTIVNVELDCGSVFAGQNTVAGSVNAGIVIQPIHTGVAISYTVTGAGTAVIVDVAGKQIASFSLEPGTRSIVWNGTGANGTKVGAGCYFVQIQSGTTRAVRSFVLAN